MLKILEEKREASEREVIVGIRAAEEKDGADNKETGADGSKAEVNSSLVKLVWDLVFYCQKYNQN